jgi:hypothetical protein
MPFTPMNNDVERVIENLEQGLPEEGAPAAQGGIGAASPELTGADQNLQDEGVLDESAAEKS